MPELRHIGMEEAHLLSTLDLLFNRREPIIQAAKCLNHDLSGTSLRLSFSLDVKSSNCIGDRVNPFRDYFSDHDNRS
jgi:hypothetical protein